MKKFLIVLVILLFGTTNFAFASAHGGCHHGGHNGGHHCSHHGGRHHSHYNHYRSSSTPKYLIGEDSSEEVTDFKDCKEHSLKVRTRILYYSDGTRYVFRKYDILNKSGEVVIDNLSYVKHQVNTKGKHYFIIKSPEYNKSKYVIIDAFGNRKTSNCYSKFEFLGNDKLVVKQDGKYGIIDYDEKVIADIKYKSLKRYGNFFITKFNGYYGLLNENGKLVLNNEYDKISRIGNVFVMKKNHKFGIINSEGEIINSTEINKIKKDGDYLKIKINNKYGLYDLNGKIITPVKYKKVRIYRNSPQIYENNTWVPIG